MRMCILFRRGAADRWRFQFSGQLGQHLSFLVPTSHFNLVNVYGIDYGLSATFSGGTTTVLGLGVGSVPNIIYNWAKFISAD